MKKIFAVFVISCCLCGFRWSFIFGELTWEKVQKEINVSYPDVRQISVEQAFQNLGKDQVVFVDVRELEEYRVSHIPGALFRDSFEPDKLPSGVVVIAYCSVGLRSAEYVSERQKDSDIQFVNLKGSLFEWANRGYPLSADGKEVSRVHPYSKRWGTLLAPGIPRYYGKN